MDFWFDVVCPYAYVASTRIPWLERVTGATVRWRPVLLGGVFRSIGAPDVPAAEMSAVKARHVERDVLASAELAGLSVSYPSDHPRRTVEAMRLLTAAPPDVVPALAADLWRAYWTDHERLTDRSLLARIGSKHGVDADRIDDADVKDALFASTEEAVRLGVFGVPSFTWPGGLTWGADRMSSLAAALGAKLDQPMPRGPIEVFHDLSSPYSYLGVATLLRERPDAVWVPMLLGALFKAIGTPIVPVATFNASKQRWVQQDLRDQAAWRGLPFRFTSHFPLNTVTALRVLCQEPRATGALYRAAWVDDLDVGRPDVLVAVLDAAGLPGRALVDGASDPTVKAALHTNTQRALELGVPGAPSFLTGGRLYWGQDRLEQAAAREGRP